MVMWKHASKHALKQKVKRALLYRVQITDPESNTNNLLAEV